MILFSGDVTIMQECIDKISDKVVRDFVELENLQNSLNNNTKFTELTNEFIKNKMFDYLKFKKPMYDVVFSDENILNEMKSNFRYFITSLSGKINFMHALPYFCISIAFQKKDENNQYKTIAGIIDSPINQETFIVEEGKGAYVNAKRMRISSRMKHDGAIMAIQHVPNKQFMVNCVNKYENLTITNCSILNICNVARGKYDMVILDKITLNEELPILVFKEAGGILKEKNTGEIILSNESIYNLS